MKKIFISYSREDYLDEQGQISAGSPVSEIVEALKAAPEIDVWIDVESRYFGQYFTTILAKQILWADKILFLSSKNSNASEWVSQELLFAYHNKKEIVPILLDDTPYNLDFALFLTGIDHIEYYKNPRQNLSYIIENLGDLKIYSEPQLSTPLEKEPSPQKKKDGFLLKTNYKGCALTLSIALSLFIVFGVFLKLPGEESIPTQNEVIAEASNSSSNTSSNTLPIDAASPMDAPICYAPPVEEGIGAIFIILSIALSLVIVFGVFLKRLTKGRSYPCCSPLPEKEEIADASNYCPNAPSQADASPVDYPTGSIPPEKEIMKVTCPIIDPQDE